MKAICVTPERRLEVRDIPTPDAPPLGHVLIDLDSATITHGDKFFLTRPLPGAKTLSAGSQAVYGANGAGRVSAIGPGVPEYYLGRQVAVYKSLSASQDSVGVWCERMQLPYSTCLILPVDLQARDYCGSFANVLTVYAFLSDIRAVGHRAIIVTAGTSATGLIALSLTQLWNVPAIFIVRSAEARENLLKQGAEHVLNSTAADFEKDLAQLSAELNTTAVFDGVGGELLGRIAPNIPANSTLYIYGFLGALVPFSISTMVIMGKNLTIRRFSNLESETVCDPRKLANAVKEIESLIGDTRFKTRIGKAFRFEEIDQAMSFEAQPGARAILTV